MRKYMALLLILLFVGLCAFIAFDEICLSAFQPDMAMTRQDVMAIAADDWGNAYYISNTNGINTLSGVDDAGHIIVKKMLPGIADAEKYRVDQLYISANKNIIAVAYEVDPVTEWAQALSVHVFYEDGSYAVRTLNRPLSMPLAECRRNVRISNMSEDDDNVYFALHENGMTECFYMPKDVYEITQKSREFKSPESFLGFYAGTSGEVVFATGRGEIRIETPEGGRAIRMAGLSARANRFYQGQGQLLNFRDALSGGLYQIDIASGRAYVLSAGSQVISMEDGVRVSDLSFCYIGRNGRLVGALQDGSGVPAFYNGGTNYVSKIRLDANTAEEFNWLIVLGLMVGVVLVSILLWQAYCYVLKMRISAIIRQSLLTALCILATMYALLIVIIRPNLEQSSERQFSSNLLTNARDMGEVIQLLDDERIALILENVRAAGIERGGLPIHYDVLSQRGLLLYSTRGLTPDALVGYELGHNGISSAIEALNGADEKERVFTVNEAGGSRMYALKQLSDGIFISSSSEVTALQAELEAIEYQVIRFLTAAGAAIMLLLTLVECFTVHNIRTLKKGVDAVSTGNYTAEIRVRSGNEIEDLANAFNTMMKLVRNTIRNLNRANTALYRFVPESLVRLLGAGSVEELSRETHAQNNMTVLYACFWLESGAKTSEELFHDINEVIGCLTPAISQNNGTVYGFQYDGFQAVFSEEAEDALRAALQIRKVTATLNAERRKAGLSAVDVRVALGKGTVMLGVVGDESRMSPVAVSEAIHSASGIIKTCRESGVYIACTEPVFERLEGYMCRRIGPMAYEQKLLEVYDFYDGDPYALLKHKQMYAGIFDEARDAFYAGDFETARQLFMQIVKTCPDDGVAKNYMYYADRYRAKRPAALYYRLYE